MGYYTLSKPKHNIPDEVGKIIDELVTRGLLNALQFRLLDTDNAAGHWYYKGGYPLTEAGKEYLNMSWYARLKQTTIITIFRDLFKIIISIF